MSVTVLASNDVLAVLLALPLFPTGLSDTTDELSKDWLKVVIPALDWIIDVDVISITFGAVVTGSFSLDTVCQLAVDSPGTNELDAGVDVFNSCFMASVVRSVSKEAVETDAFAFVLIYIDQIVVSSTGLDDISAVSSFIGVTRLNVDTFSLDNVSAELVRCVGDVEVKGAVVPNDSEIISSLFAVVEL